MGTGEQQDMEMWVRNSGHSPNLGRLRSFENQGSRDDWKIANLQGVGGNEFKGGLQISLIFQ